MEGGRGGTVRNGRAIGGRGGGGQGTAKGSVVLRSIHAKLTLVRGKGREGGRHKDWDVKKCAFPLALLPSLSALLSLLFSSPPSPPSLPLRTCRRCSTNSSSPPFSSPLQMCLPFGTGVIALSYALPSLPPSLPPCLFVPVVAAPATLLPPLPRPLPASP